MPGNANIISTCRGLLFSSGEITFYSAITPLNQHISTSKNQHIKPTHPHPFLSESESPSSLKL